MREKETSLLLYLVFLLILIHGSNKSENQKEKPSQLSNLNLLIFILFGFCHLVFGTKLEAKLHYTLL
jgi:hypothetical protein